MKAIHYILRGFAYLFIGILGLILLALIALYLPPVQDYAVGRVLETVNSNDSLQVEVGKLRLYPPLSIEVHDVVVKQSGDTTVAVGKLETKLSVPSLWRGNLALDGIDIKNVVFNNGNPDSAMYLRSHLDNFSVETVRLKPLSHIIEIDNTVITRPGVSIDLIPNDEPSDTTTSADLPWKLHLNRVTIDSLSYAMSMRGTIDTITAIVPQLVGDDIKVDLSTRNVDVRSLVAGSIDALYVFPETTATAEDEKPATVEPADTVPPQLWTINVAEVDLRASDVLYRMAGATPLPGLDFNYIELSNVEIDLDSIYNQGSTITLDINRIAARERCGLDLLLKGVFSMDSDSMAVRDIELSTLNSRLQASFVMGMGDTELPSPLNLNATGIIDPADVAMAFPSFYPLAKGLPANTPLTLEAAINGRDDLYNIDAMELTMDHVFNLSAYGSMYSPLDLKRADGDITLQGAVTSSRFTRPSRLAAMLNLPVDVPPMRLSGDIKAHGGTLNGNMKVVTGKGRLGVDGRWVTTNDGYRASVNLDNFPAQAFVPQYEVSDVTASLEAHGQNFNIMSPRAQLELTAKVDEATWRGHSYSGLSLNADIDSGRATVALNSAVPVAALSLRADGNLTGTTYDWHLNGDLRNIDLQAMGLTDSIMNGNGRLYGDISFTPVKPMDVRADFTIASLDWTMSSGQLSFENMVIGFATADSLTSLSINQGDFAATLNSDQCLDTIMARITISTAILDSASVHHRADIPLLQSTLPSLDFNLKAGEKNFLNSYLVSTGMDFSSIDLSASTDSLIDMQGRVIGFTSGSTVLDTLSLDIHQVNDVLNLKAHMGNRPGTLDQWAQVDLTGSINYDQTSIMIHQRDIHGSTGYNLGFRASMPGEDLIINVIPQHPIIGYKEWSVNDSNYVLIDIAKKHLDADLLMRNSESSIHLYTNHVEGNDSTQEDVILNVKDIQIADWIKLNPYAPPVTGSVSSDMRFGWGDNAINGSGNVSVDSLTYGRDQVGSFDLGVDLMTNAQGTVRASATLLINGVKTITAVGNLNDSTAVSPFLLDFRMIHLPLEVLNPFLPKDMARLRGTLNGTMDITGSLTEPIFNGFIDFDSTVLRIPMLGTEFAFSDVKIPVDSNVIDFNNFTITGPNPNPLSLTGTVDARHISDIGIDLTARAENMQVVNSKKGRGVSVYGKMFINLLATIKGNMDRLNVNANLSVLPTTDVTYINTSASNTLKSKSTAGVVKFVNFADTTAVEAVDTLTSSSMLIGLNASLNLMQGNTINVDLSSDGKNRVQLLSSGTLNYVMDYMGDTHITGRLNLNSGFVRYTPPFMSEKLFKFQEGSYISFSGNMMNPYLNIKAIDVLRANVQQEGQNSRLINFDVILTVTNSLENMDVAFDLATNDDITVANELQSMTPTQRANQAMNLLLYNVYTGPGTKASSSLSGNPLFSFLESQVNSWAANNIKGVDLSFGIDQYDSTTNGAQSTTTSYSYKVSKSLFNNRFKISVGGNYSSDADADQNLSQNLINDISFEYYITPSGNMYVKVFRHTGYESILEGEITKTGVGFVYKRKLRYLSDLFKPLNYFRRFTNKASGSPTQQTNAQQDSTPTQSTAK